MDDIPQGPLRYGWTTGACAAAAAKAAFTALLTGEFPDPVDIVLPGGQRPAFALALASRDPDGAARAGIIKDAGDDPDVTHGALIIARVMRGEIGSGIRFLAGEGVGTVTLPGLPLPPGEPAINPVPRRLISEGIAEVAMAHGVSPDAVVEISIPGGEALAAKTLNGRLGILGGLSILGTTGVVVPFSCAAWIHSIHRGIDVAHAAGLHHVAGATGNTSEVAVARHYQLPELALMDMGDFVGGMLKYMRKVPIPRVTIAGGFAKMTKLAQGLLDLHSRAGSVDLPWLAGLARDHGATDELAQAIAAAHSANHALSLCAAAKFDVARWVAVRAQATAAAVVRTAPIAVDVLVVDREGRVLAVA